MYPVKLDNKRVAVADGVLRVRSHYNEMPGLSLDFPQALRLIGLDPDTMGAVFGELTDGKDRFLIHVGGKYIRNFSH